MALAPFPLAIISHLQTNDVASFFSKRYMESREMAFLHASVLITDIHLMSYTQRAVQIAFAT